jgi:hypothetical protein
MRPNLSPRDAAADGAIQPEQARLTEQLLDEPSFEVREGLAFYIRPVFHREPHNPRIDAGELAHTLKVTSIPRRPDDGIGYTRCIRRRINRKS